MSTKLAWVLNTEGLISDRPPDWNTCSCTSEPKVTYPETGTISVKTSAWETWSKSRADENMMSIYERKILRSIFGGIQEKGTWRRSNLELYRSFKESDIVNFVKKQRIKWAGQVIRMNEDRITKKVFNAQPMGT
ncbi:uncharacterized protein TNCV_1367351 [Trichonephila clavipes]|nr:uncharacterized protein TNCV_1367351 [Trichonephila clavipes]